MLINVFIFMLCVLSSKVITAKKVNKQKVYSGLRIIGGRTANIKDFPFFVSIQTFDKDWLHFCGGSILTPKVVLTACHCLVVSKKPLILDDPKTIRVIAGINDLSKSSIYSQVRNSSRFVVHPDCGRPETNEGVGDAGVIELADPFTYNAAIQPLKVVDKDVNTAVEDLQRLRKTRTTCCSPGWGTESTKPNKWPTELKVAKLTVLSSSDCRKILCPYSKTFCLDFDKDRQLCAVAEDASVCDGDSGGPLVCNGFIYGVISRGPGCYIGIPQVYTNIDPLLYFVNKYT